MALHPRRRGLFSVVFCFRARSSSSGGGGWLHEIRTRQAVCFKTPLCASPCHFSTPHPLQQAHALVFGDDFLGDLNHLLVSVPRQAPHQHKRRKLAVPPVPLKLHPHGHPVRKSQLSSQQPPLLGTRICSPHALDAARRFLGRFSVSPPPCHFPAVL